RVGRPAPHPRAAARALRLAARPRRERPDRRLVLPPVGLRGAAAGAEPVRRRAGGVPHRPGRRRVRLPVRDPRRVPRGQHPAAGRVHPDLARVRALPGPAPATERRRVLLLLLLRHVQGRVHGGQVLHRAAAGRPRPRVRAGARREAARGPPRGPLGHPPAVRRPLPPHRARPPVAARPGDAAEQAAGAPAGERLRGEPPRRAAAPLRPPTPPLETTQMFKNPWFETVAEAERRAKRRLPYMVYGALVAGSERGRTVSDNIKAFGDLGFAPRVVGRG